MREHAPCTFLSHVPDISVRSFLSLGQLLLVSSCSSVFLDSAAVPPYKQGFRNPLESIHDTIRIRDLDSSAMARRSLASTRRHLARGGL
jgi:hypothetical protein